MGVFALVHELLVIHDDAFQIFGILDDGSNVTVAQITNRKTVRGHEAVIHSGDIPQQTEGGGVHRRIACLAAIRGHGVLRGLDVGKRISGSRSSPQRIAGQRKVVGGFPLANAAHFGVIVVGVINAIGFDGNANVAVLGKQELHNHPFWHHQSAFNQVVRVIKNTGNNFLGVGVVSVQNAQDFLPVFFFDLETFTEERHFGFRQGHAGTVTEGSLRIESGGHQGNRQTFVALNPFQIKTGLLFGGEQGFAQIGDSVAYSLSPVRRNRFRADYCTESIKIHNDYSFLYLVLFRPLHISEQVAASDAHIRIYAVFAVLT